MTEGRREKTGWRPETGGRRRTYSLQPTAYSLLILCLCILALRVTYTESPTSQVLMMPGSLGDTVYSLTLSGLLIFTFLLWLLWGVFTGRLVYRFTGIEIGLAIFGVAAVLAAAGASDKRAAITQIMTIIGPICAALLLAQILDHPAKIRLVLLVLVGLGIVSAYQCAEQRFISNAIMIEQYEKNPQLLLEPLGIETGTFQHFLFEHRLYTRGVRGFFTTSNSAASFAILAFAAAAVLLVQKFREHRTRAVAPRYRWLAVLATVLVGAGLLLTESKGGILAFLAGLVFCALAIAVNRWLPERRQLVVSCAIPLTLLLAAGAGYALVDYGLKHGRLPGGNSMLVRWQYWTASAKMYADHRRTGVGPGNFSDNYTRYKPAAALESVADPHNFLLSLMTQYGPLGLIGFLAMVFLPLWRSVTAPALVLPVADTHPQPSFKTVALGTVLAICACLLLVRALLIPAPTDSPDVLLYEVVTVHIAPVAALLIGFLLMASPLGNTSTRQTDLPIPILYLVFGCAVLAVLLHNLVDYALFEPGVWMTFWVVLACLTATRVQRRTDFRVIALGERVRKPLALGVAAAALAVYGLYVWKPACDTATGIQRAQHGIAAGNYDVAHVCLEAAARADPLSPVAAAFNGRLYSQQYEQAQPRRPALLEGAAQCLQVAIERNPADYKNWENLGTVYSRLGQPQKAYDAYLRAAALYPGRERLWFELAQTAEKLGKPGLALCHYTKAVEIEEAYRQQFRQMYPDRSKVVSRLGEQDYQRAKERIEELSK